MLTLKKIEENEECYKLLYIFTKNNNLNWKTSTQISFSIQGLRLPKQGDLSDYEYFKQLKALEKKGQFLSSEQYMLVNEEEPITSVYVMMRTKNIADVSFVTARKYQRKGYATQALALVEKELFKNPDILFTTITDLSPNKISSKIAINSGYTCLDDTKAFVKANPNYTLEEITKSKKLTSK